MYGKIVERILYPLVTRYRGSSELAILRELEKSQFLSEEQLIRLRLERLRRLLKHAHENVPFHRKRIREAGINPDSVNNLDVLKQLPLMTKTDIQQHRPELTSIQFSRSKLIENSTGGSTGHPLQFYLSKESVDARQAATLRHNAWAGYRVGDKTAIIWGHQHDLSLFTSLKARVRNRLIDRQLFCDSASFSDDGLRAFAGQLRKFKPEIILAYANSLVSMIDFFEDAGIELPSPRSIITSAEILTPENRLRIERYFRAPVFDRYGARETSVIASECTAHEGMHICAENLIVEFLKSDRDAQIGEEGEIVVTQLTNLAFPLIRYQIGDIGAPAPSGCTCGVTLPKMQMVAGRTTDFLLAPDGRRVSGAALTIYLAAKVKGIRQAQIVQRELRKLTFNLVLGPEFDDDSRRHMSERVNHFFGPEMNWEINRLDEIPRESSGKYRFSICQVAGVK